MLSTAAGADEAVAADLGEAAGPLPDFVVIGAMKAATSTLHEQLAAQPGIFMSTPKEPNFFSDDAIYARGLGWYRSLFAEAPAGALKGESSTHYTKLPTHPLACDRLRRHLPRAKLIYVMRHPLDRLVSHYIHEWTQAVISEPIGPALDRHPELVGYGLYAMQLEPYLRAFGPASVLPVFGDRLRVDPRGELERACRFLGYGGVPRWSEAADGRNASSRRLRKSAWRDALVEAPVLSTIRRRLVPRGVRDRVKRLWTMERRPAIPADRIEGLKATFDADLARLGAWLGISLSCDTFGTVAVGDPPGWVAAPGADR